MRRVPEARGAQPLVMLDTAYLAGAGLCLLAFIGEYDPGAYLVMAAAAASAARLAGGPTATPC
jgi:hypothetical protein